MISTVSREHGIYKIKSTFEDDSFNVLYYYGFKDTILIAHMFRTIQEKKLRVFSIETLDIKNYIHAAEFICMKNDGEQFHEFVQRNDKKYYDVGFVEYDQLHKVEECFIPYEVVFINIENLKQKYPSQPKRILFKGCKLYSDCSDYEEKVFHFIEPIYNLYNNLKPQDDVEEHILMNFNENMVFDFVESGVTWI